MTWIAEALRTVGAVCPSGSYQASDPVNTKIHKLIGILVVHIKYIRGKHEPRHK